MGMQRTVRFASGSVPGWDAIRDHLARLGTPTVLQMIDGLPAFPDEIPEPGWKELRVGTPGGMVTVRGDTGSLACVVWGNASETLRASWDAVCWACAAAGGGEVETAAGYIPAAAFARQVGIQPA